MAMRNPEYRMMPDREYDRHLLIHRYRMQNMRAQVDNQPPQQYAHIMLRLKHLKAEEQRKAQTDKENKLLLKRMTTIMTSKSDYQTNNRRSRSMNLDKRRREHDRVAADNVYIAHKIEKTRPYYSVDKWEQDHRERQILLERLRRIKSGGGSPNRSPRPARRKPKHAAESDTDRDNSDDEEKERTKSKDRLPPIKSAQKDKKYEPPRSSRSEPPRSSRSEPNTARSDRSRRSPSPDKKHRSPDPELWMYYGVRPGDSDDEDDFYYRGTKDENKGTKDEKKKKGTKKSKVKK